MMKKYILATLLLFSFFFISTDIHAKIIVLDEFETVNLSSSGGDMNLPNTRWEKGTEPNLAFTVNTSFTSPYDGGGSVNKNYPANTTSSITSLASTSTTTANIIITTTYVTTSLASTSTTTANIIITTTYLTTSTAEPSTSTSIPENNATTTTTVQGGSSTTIVPVTTTTVPVTTTTTISSQITCIDSDNDTYFEEGGDCGEKDCDDNDAAINPGAEEVCDDGKDNNCDGEFDESCGSDCQITNMFPMQVSKSAGYAIFFITISSSCNNGLAFGQILSTTVSFVGPGNDDESVKMIASLAVNNIVMGLLKINKDAVTGAYYVYVQGKKVDVSGAAVSIVQ